MDRDDAKAQGPRDRSAEREDYGLGANPPGVSVHLESLRMMDYQKAMRLDRQALETARLDLVKMPDGTVLHIKPLRYTLGLGVPGVLLLAASMLLHVLLKAYGNPFIGASGQDYAGLVRLLAMLTGGIMLIIAWPIKKPLGWTLEQQEQYEDTKVEAAGKRWREHR